MITYNPVVQGMGTGQVELPERVNQSLPIDVSGISNIAQSYASNVMAEADAEARWAAMTDAKQRQAKEDIYKEEKMQMAREKHAMAIEKHTMAVESHQWGAEKMQFARNSEARNQFNFEQKQQQLADGKQYALALDGLDNLRQQTNMSPSEYNTRVRQLQDTTLANSSLSAEQIHSISSNYSGDIQTKLIAAEVDRMKRADVADENSERAWLDKQAEQLPAIQGKSYAYKKDYVAGLEALTQTMQSNINLAEVYKQSGRSLPADLRNHLYSSATDVGLQAAINTNMKILQRSEGLTPQSVAAMQDEIMQNFMASGFNPADASWLANRSVSLSGKDIPSKYLNNYLQAVADTAVTSKALENGGMNLLNIMANSPKSYQPMMKALMNNQEFADQMHVLGTSLAAGLTQTGGEVTSRTGDANYTIDSIPPTAKMALAQVAPMVVESEASTPAEKTSATLGVMGMMIDNMKTGAKTLFDVGSEAIGEAAAFVATGGESLTTPTAEESTRRMNMIQQTGADAKVVVDIMRKGNPSEMTPEMRQSVYTRADNIFDGMIGEIKTEMGDRFEDLRYDPETQRIVMVESNKERGLLDKTIDYFRENFLLESLKKANEVNQQSFRYAADNRDGHKANVEDTMKYYGIKNKERDEQTVSPNVLTSIIQTSKAIPEAVDKTIEVGNKIIANEASVSDIVSAATTLADTAEPVTNVYKGMIDAVTTSYEYVKEGAQNVNKLVTKAADALQERFEEDYYKRHPEARGAMDISNIENEELFQ